MLPTKSQVLVPTERTNMNPLLVTTLQIIPNVSGGTYDVSEAHEVTIKLPLLSLKTMTMDEIREHVRIQMPGESYQVIDNVTECLYKRHHH